MLLTPGVWVRCSTRPRGLQRVSIRRVSTCQFAGSCLKMKITEDCSDNSNTRSASAPRGTLRVQALKAAGRSGIPQSLKLFDVSFNGVDDDTKRPSKIARTRKTSPSSDSDQLAATISKTHPAAPGQNLTNLMNYLMSNSISDSKIEGGCLFWAKVRAEHVQLFLP